MRIYASVFHRSLMLSNYCVKSHLEQFTHCEALILTNVHVVFELKLSILEWLYCVPWSEKNYAFLAYTKYTSIERIFFWGSVKAQLNNIIQTIYGCMCFDFGVCLCDFVSIFKNHWEVSFLPWKSMHDIFHIKKWTWW